MCTIINSGRKRRRRSYVEQQKKQAEAWDAIAKSLEDKYLPTNVFDANTICSVCAEPAVFRCTDCGPWIAYCEHCCITQHNQCCFLHVPEKWEHGHYIPVMLMNVEIPLDHCCSTEYKDKITIISLKGLCNVVAIGICQYPVLVVGYHNGIVVSFCRCKTKVERLVELHLWPATPQSPRVAFTMELLDIIHAAMLECQVSLYHASSMLQYLSTLKMVCTETFMEKSNVH